MLNDKEKGEERLQNLDELNSNLIRFKEENPESDLSDFLEEVALLTDIDNYNSDADAVVLMTLHSSKGLEFPVVIIPSFKIDNFPKKFEKAPYFCLPHYRAMIDYASKKMGKKIFADFYKVASGIEENYIDTLTSDVSWFCKKFDYRYDDEPWYNSKDSVPRAVKFLSGDPKDDV